MTMRVRKAVFPVGGLGTRFLPATKAMPKEMLPVVDKPLIQYAVEEASAAGIEEIIFVTGRGKTAIEDHFDHHVELEHDAREPRQEDRARRGSGRLAAEARQHSPIRASRSRSASAMPSGARATWSATSRSRCCSPTTWCWPSTPCLKQMVEPYNEVGGNIVAVDGRAARADQSLRHPRSRAGRRPPGRGQGAGREAEAGQRRPRPCRSSAATSCSPNVFAHLGPAGARRRRRDPAHRRAWRA